MKLLLIILSMVVSFNAGATHWLTYYVYFETEYVQGPWTPSVPLKQSNYRYLAPQAYEDLFGSEEADLINQMLFRLKEKKPDLYDWAYNPSVQKDTVILEAKALPDQWETVKNEVTATMTLNGFKAVAFRFGKEQEILTINDLTLPYFDLRQPGQKPLEDQKIETDTNDREEKKENIQTEPQMQEHNPLTFWLIVSGILNVGLIVLLVKKKG